MLGILWCCASLVLQEPPSSRPAVELVRVELEASGCFHQEAQQYSWVQLGDGFRWRDRRLSRAEIEGLRKAIAEARREVPGLLAELGLTPQALAAHRDEVVARAMPEALREEAERAPPPELEPLLAWERLAPLIRAELLGKHWVSTERRLVRATFVSDGHELVAESKGLVPWMLPWTVTLDGRAFTSEDLAVPRAVLRLVDPKAPGVELLDGSSALPDWIWESDTFWTRFVGQELDQALSGRRYAELAGWTRAAGRFLVRSVSTGSIDMLPESMYFELETAQPATVDRARWHDFLVGDEPAQTWDDFLAVYDRAAACVERQAWLAEWKSLAPKRHVELAAAGTQGFAEDMLEELVLPAWVDAGFHGAPEFELALREDGKWVGTVFLSSRVSSALITSAHVDRVLEKRLPRSATKREPAGAPAAPPPHHWFDDLELSYHPNGDPPTYARVDAEGRVEVRTMPRATGRR